jgi:hypothetical protein
MAEGRQLRERNKREYLPADPGAEEPRFGSANEWGRKQLKMLGVTFAPNARKRLDLNAIVDIVEEWPASLQRRMTQPILYPLSITGVDSCCRELAAVDMDLVQNKHITEDDIGDLAPHFTHTFNSLLGVMTLQDVRLQRRADREAKASALADATSTPTIGQKRAPPTSVASKPGKRSRTEGDSKMSEHPTTPDQPTYPVDSNFTGSSAESKDEPHTRELLEDFLKDTLLALKTDFKRLVWLNSTHIVELGKT